MEREEVYLPTYLRFLARLVGGSAYIVYRSSSTTSYVMCTCVRGGGGGGKAWYA